MNKQEQTIILKTTPGEEIPGHLAANGRCRRCDKLKPFSSTARINVPVCTCTEPIQIPVFHKHREFKKLTLALCGAGPSLKGAIREVRKADHVWGCNRAANYLADWAGPWTPTHGFAIDASPGMFTEAWSVVPKVSDYFILATSVNPKLVDHVLASEQPIRFFHSIRGGIPNEMELYQHMFPPTPIVSRGLNSVNRALCLALWLGYKRIYVCGADNAFGAERAFYADGTKRDDACVMEGTVDGRTFYTTPDMLMSATDLARLAKENRNVVRLVGDVLPRAMSRKSEKFLNRCVRWETDDERETREAVQAVAEADGMTGLPEPLARLREDMQLD